MSPEQIEAERIAFERWHAEAFPWVSLGRYLVLVYIDLQADRRWQAWLACAKSKAEASREAL